MLPISDASKIAVDTSFNFMETHDALEKVIFILFSASDLNVYRRYLASAIGA